MHLNTFWAICMALSSTRNFQVLRFVFLSNLWRCVKSHNFDGHGRLRKEAARCHSGTGHEHGSSGAQEDKNRGKLSHDMTELNGESFPLAAKRVSTSSVAISHPPTHIICHLEVVLFMSGSGKAGRKRAGQ